MQDDMVIKDASENRFDEQGVKMEGKVSRNEKLRSSMSFFMSLKICRTIVTYIYILLSHYVINEYCGDTRNTLQKLQNKAARYTMSSPFDSSAAPLLQRLGWLSGYRIVHIEKHLAWCIKFLK